MGKLVGVVDPNLQTHVSTQQPGKPQLLIGHDRLPCSWFFGFCLLTTVPQAQRPNSKELPPGRKGGRPVLWPGNPKSSQQATGRVSPVSSE